MALTASVPVLTARGDELDEHDGYIADFKVVKRIAKIAAVPAGEKTKGRDERAAHTLINVGNCDGLNIDTETGFIGMFALLQYTELLCSSDLLSLKRCVTGWFKKSTSAAISMTLLKRDRGTAQFLSSADGAGDIYVHPTQLLANIDVGASTRTWMISAAAFVLSYHQISRAFDKYPRDFARIDDHIEALQARVKVLNSRAGGRKLREAAMAVVKPPYPDFDYQAVGHDALNRLALFARTDLAVMKYLKKLSALTETEHEEKTRKSRRKTEFSVVPTTVEQLRFLKDVAETNGDLWFERSAHTYVDGEQTGAIVVFPSGYLYSIVGEPGMTTHHLMRDRTALSRMESLIPYLPYEFSGYTGDINRLALLEAEQRKGKKGSVASKADLDTAKTAIMSYAMNLSIAMIVDPLMLELVGKVSTSVSGEHKKSRPKKEEVAMAAEVKLPAPTLTPTSVHESEAASEDVSVTIDEEESTTVDEPVV